MESNWTKKRIDLYLSAVIIPSIILSILALWTLVRQYRLIKYTLAKHPELAESASNLFGSFSWVSIFAFAMIIFALLLILTIGSYLSSHDLQRQLEVAKLKSDFVYTVSHELKTPLTSIRLLSERLLKLTPKELTKQKEYQGLILTQSYQLSQLIANILDFSKLDQEGKEIYHFEKTDIGTLIKQVIDDYPAKLVRPNCKLEIKLKDGMPLVMVDKQMLSRAFSNLLSNAFKFSPDHGLIGIKIGIKDNNLFIEVSDQGPGIDVSVQDKIFERFYHHGKGTGLGLALVRQIAQGHKGEVELESEKGKGSTFRIVLPLP